MRSGQLTTLVLQPSLFSATTSLLSSALLLGVANWPSVMQQPMVHDYFLGSEGLVTLLRDPNNSAGSALTGLFNQSNINNVVTLLAALGFGVIVLIVLEIIRRARADAGPITRWEARLRFMTRLSVVVLWLVYFVVTLKIIFPFCILASEVGVHALWDIKGLVYLLFGLLLLSLSFHVHVICMRLFLLRIRVFGGEEALMRAEMHD
jgi:hypothetical protein